MVTKSHYIHRPSIALSLKTDIDQEVENAEKQILFSGFTHTNSFTGHA